jgi:hypothetical protein
MIERGLLVSWSRFLRKKIKLKFCSVPSQIKRKKLAEPSWTPCGGRSQAPSDRDLPRKHPLCPDRTQSVNVPALPLASEVHSEAPSGGGRVRCCCQLLTLLSVCETGHTQFPSFFCARIHANA